MTSSYSVPDQDAVNFDTRSYSTPDQDTVNFTISGEFSKDTVTKTDTAEVTSSTATPLSTTEVVSVSKTDTAVTTQSTASPLASTEVVSAISITDTVPTTTSTITPLATKETRWDKSKAGYTGKTQAIIARETDVSSITTSDFPVKVKEELEICVNDFRNVEDLDVSTYTTGTNCSVNQTILESFKNSATDCYEITIELEFDCPSATTTIGTETVITVEFQTC